MEMQLKLRRYRQLKNCFKTEDYALSSMSKSNHSFIAQLCTGTLPLIVEIGRLQEKKLGERMFVYIPVYAHCEDDTVKNELHLIFCCPPNSILRTSFTNVVDHVIDIGGKGTIEKLKLFMNISRAINSRSGSYIKDYYFKRYDFIFNSSDS